MNMEIDHKFLEQFAERAISATLFNWEEEAEYYDHDPDKPFTLQYLDANDEVIAEFEGLEFGKIEGALSDDFFFQKDDYSLYTFAYFPDTKHVYPYSWEAESIVAKIQLLQNDAVVYYTDFEHENEEYLYLEELAHDL